MKLCLSCWRISPRDATHCSYCGKTFGAKLCRSKKPHRNPFDARHCAQCGSADLTDPTRHLSCGCVSHLLAWGMALLVLGCLLPRAWQFLPAIATGGLRAICALLHLLPLHTLPLAHLLNRCWEWVVALLIYYVTVMCLLSLLPDEIGKPIQKVISGVALFLPKLGLAVLRFLFGALRKRSH